VEDQIYKPGDQIGNYEVLEFIGGGGFSAIYKAKDLKDVPKAAPSALKISRFDYRTLPRDLRLELNARMHREQEALVRLDHQNIVRTFEWGEHEGKVWYAMELLQGPTLGTYLAEERRSFLDLMFTYRQLLEAVDCCHKFLARQETTLAETPVQGRRDTRAEEVGNGASADTRPTAAELLASEVKQLARLTRTSHWAIVAAIVALVVVSVRSELRAQREDARIGRVEARQANGGESAGGDVRDVQPPSMIEEARPGSVSANPPVVPPVRPAVSGGLKMPDKPNAKWLRPGKDGICRNPKTGEEVRTQAVIRGTCWEVGRKLPGEPSCPQGTYDPPPEVLKDPKVPDLHRSCFIPWIVDDANALVPH